MAEPAILHGTDFSDQSDVALEFARRLAREAKRRLLIVHVGVPPGQAAMATAPADAASLPMTTPASSLGKEESAALQQKLAAMQSATDGVQCDVLLLEGDPATELVRLAETGDVDQIVLGSHGRTGLSRLLLGSVAEAVVRRAPCPVTIVKSKREQPAAS